MILLESLLKSRYHRLVKDIRGQRPRLRPHYTKAVVSRKDLNLQFQAIVYRDSSLVDRRMRDHLYSVFNGGKYGIVITGIISTRKSSSSDSSIFLCVGVIHLLLRLRCQSLSVVQVSVTQLVMLRHGSQAEQDGSNSNIVSYLGSLIVEVRLLMQTVDLPLLKTDSVVVQLRNELVKSSIALIVQSFGRGTVMVVILTFTFTIAEIECKRGLSDTNGFSICRCN
ncbi:MAG: hypothetical protein EZS28_003402 [Streblomastix strix]|uniref:Uncharacterized protein n=1 Tax=Streblomastix strix TaxID=222440 RepID=A0A5J4X1H3_9EUKA|nr:MAG: hypothetical protein EZS28_003402 [Streblomastix strix]